MVPGQWVVLDRMPLSPNGKLDRKALPTPDAPQQAAYLAPQSVHEQQLAAIWSDLLGVPPGVAGLRIERISYLPSGKVVEFTRSLYRGDAYDFAVELKLAPDGERKPE